LGFHLRLSKPWFGSVAVECRTGERKITGSIPTQAAWPSNDPGQVVHTCASVTKWYNMVSASSPGTYRQYMGEVWPTARKLSVAFALTACSGPMKRR